MIPKPRFLSVRSVAQTFVVSEQTIRCWCRAGKLAYVQIGRTIRITAESVDALIKPTTEQTAAA